MKKITCFECCKPAAHNHHVVPVSRGGTRTVPLCMDCHGKVHGEQALKMWHLSMLARERIKQENGGKLPWTVGRPKGTGKITPAVLDEIRTQQAQGRTVIQISKALSLSRAGIYKALNKARVAEFVEQAEPPPPPPLGDGI